MKVLNTKQRAAGIFLLLALIVSAGCNFNFSVGKPKEPTGDEIQKLIKSTMADFAESVEKDDFDILRKNASTTLRQQASAEKFKNAFKVYIAKKEGIVPLFREAQSMDAEIKTQTMKQVDEAYLLETSGKFPTTDTEIAFRLEYLREDGKWKLLTIDITT